MSILSMLTPPGRATLDGRRVDVRGYVVLVGKPPSALIRRALANVKPGDVDAFSAQMRARVEAAHAARGGRR